MLSLQRSAFMDCAVRVGCLLVFAWILSVASPLTYVAAQSTSPAKDFRWSGILQQGRVIEVRGVYGSIRAIPSTNSSIQVDAHIQDPALVHVDVVPGENGVTICSVFSTSSGDEIECQPGRRKEGAKEPENRIDFVIHVPAGVRLSASMIHGDITVDSFGSDVNVATIDGNINLNLSRKQGAEFYGNTVSGEIDSDFPIYDNVPPPPGDRYVEAHRPRIVRARIGNGGPTLIASAVRGDIRLRTNLEQ